MDIQQAIDEDQHIQRWIRKISNIVIKYGDPGPKGYPPNLQDVLDIYNDLIQRRIEQIVKATQPTTD